MFVARWELWGFGGGGRGSGRPGPGHFREIWARDFFAGRVRGVVVSCVWCGRRRASVLEPPISEHIPTPSNLRRISEHVSHASGSAPFLSTHPMPHAFRPRSEHFPNIFRIYAAHFGTFGGLSLVGCPRLPPRWCIVRRCFTGMRGASTPASPSFCHHPGDTGAQRHKQVPPGSLRGLARDALQLFEADGRGVRPGPSLLEVLEVRRPRRHVEGHLGEGRSGIEAAVQAQENEARASSQKACSGHTWLSRFLRVSVSWQGQRVIQMTTEVLLGTISLQASGMPQHVLLSTRGGGDLRRG